MNQLYSYQPSRRSTVPPPKRPIKPTYHVRAILGFLVVLAIFITGVRVVSAFHASNQQKRAHALSSSNLLPMNTALKKIVSSQPYQIGITIEDISNSDQLNYGSTSAFDAASTAKVIAACAYYHLVETGQASLTVPMGAYDAQFALQTMINISDNDSWHLITAAVGVTQLKAYAQSIGVEYTTGANQLTSAGMASLLSQLYSGKLLDQADTAQLLGYMQNTNEEDLIPAAVPSGITVYHKYGLLNGALHDAAILVKGDKKYALVIYTQNTDDSDDAARTDTMHDITKVATQYLFQ